MFKGQLMNDKDSIQNIRKWWNENPYSYGLSSGGKYLDVGVPKNEELGNLFQKYEAKYRKHLKESMDSQNRPAGKYIPYDLLKGKKVLDVACGMGWASINLARNQADVEAIDLTPNAVIYTKQHADFLGLNLNVQERSAEEIRFPDCYFDFVLGWGFLMHTENPEKALSEMLRVVKEDGSIVLYFYYKHSVSYWWHIWLLRGVLLGYLVRFKGNRIKLVSRFTDGQSFGGNMKTDVFSKNWFKRQAKLDGFSCQFTGFGPSSLLDSWPVSFVPVGKLLPRKFKLFITQKIGFGHIVTLTKLH
jgi:ubiquinone/menaquinone biosynthesis C-methylase UbiE